jgi:hypothetical protein
MDDLRIFLIDEIVTKCLNEVNVNYQIGNGDKARGNYFKMKNNRPGVERPNNSNCYNGARAVLTVRRRSCGGRRLSIHCNCKKKLQLPQGKKSPALLS